MARIRTIKPEFFEHYELWQAEVDSGLPLRIAFAGLWCEADRDGRFKWRPKQLKLHVLPFDELDFSRVLDALATRGFVVKYEANGEEFGAIPSWRKHQVINNRERKSDLPEPNNIKQLPTRRARDDHADLVTHGNAQAEGEGESKEESTTDVVPKNPDMDLTVPEFLDAKKRKDAGNGARQGTRCPADLEITGADRKYARSCGHGDDRIASEWESYVAHFSNGTGRNRTSANWHGGNSSWGTWCRNEAKWAAERSANRPSDQGSVAAVRSLVASGE